MAEWNESLQAQRLANYKAGSIPPNINCNWDSIAANMPPENDRFSPVISNLDEILEQLGPFVVNCATNSMSQNNRHRQPVTKTSGSRTTLSENLLSPRFIHGNYTRFTEIVANNEFGHQINSGAYGVLSVSYNDPWDWLDHDFLFYTDHLKYRVIGTARNPGNTDEPHWLSVVGGYGTGTQQYYGPNNMAFLSNQWYVSDGLNNRVQVYDLDWSTGATSYRHTIEATGYVADVAAARIPVENPINDIFEVAVLDSEAERVKIYDYSGNYQRTLPMVLRGGTSICYLRNYVTHYPMRYIYAVSNQDKRVYRTPTNGLQPDVETPIGLFPDDARLSSISVDAYAMVYVLDNYNSILYVLGLDLSEIIATFGVSSGTANNQLYYPNRFKIGERWDYSENEGRNIPVPVGDAFVTECFSQNTGVRRYILGCDILSYEMSYSPMSTPGYGDYVKIQWKQSNTSECWRWVWAGGNQLAYQHDDLNVGWASHHQQYNLQANDPDSTWYKFVIRVKSKFGSTDTTLVDSIYVERDLNPGPQIVLDSFEVYDPSGELTADCIYDNPDRFWATVIDVRDSWDGDSVLVWLRQGQVPTVSAYFTKDTTELLFFEYIGQQHTDDLDTIYFKVTSFPSGLANGGFVDLLQLQMLVHPDPFHVPDTNVWEFPWLVSRFNRRMYQDSCSTPCFDTCIYYPPPGCPMLYSWNGSEYVLENNLLPQSEESDRPVQDITDVFVLDYAHLDQAHQYKFRIAEDEAEVSRFRRLKAFALDIPQGITKLIFDNQHRLGFLTGNGVNPTTAVTHDGLSVVESLAEADSVLFSSDEPGYIDLVYPVGSRNRDRMSLGPAPGGGIDPPPPDKNHGKSPPDDEVRAGPNIYIIQAQTENGQYVEVGKRHARRRQLGRPIDLSDYVFDGVLHARLAWTQRVELDHLPYLHYDRLDIRPRRLPLVEAMHSDSGDVLSNLSESGSGFVSLQPGQRLDLTYQAPPLADSLQRLILFRAVGRYEVYTPPSDKLAETMPERFTFSQNYPNPFNPSTTFNFALPRHAHVSLCVYNVLGQKVATVIDQNYPSGRHTYDWNGMDDRGQALSSGVYFARFVAGGFASTKKMVVVK